MNFTLTTDAGNLDILGEVTGMGDYEKVVNFSEEMEIFGLTCRVLTLEGLKIIYERNSAQEVKARA